MLEEGARSAGRATESGHIYRPTSGRPMDLEECSDVIRAFVWQSVASLPIVSADRVHISISDNDKKN